MLRLNYDNWCDLSKGFQWLYRKFNSDWIEVRREADILSNIVHGEGLVFHTAAEWQEMVQAEGQEKHFVYLSSPAPGGLFSFDPTDTTSVDDQQDVVVTADGHRYKRNNILNLVIYADLEALRARVLALENQLATNDFA